MAELIIVFREVLEASLIIGILYTYLNKSNNNSSIKMLWGGVLSAVIASIGISILFQNLLGGFQGNSAKISSEPAAAIPTVNEVGKINTGVADLYSKPGTAKAPSTYTSTVGDAEL